jgi:hypothetical protein
MLVVIVFIFFSRVRRKKSDNREAAQLHLASQAWSRIVLRKINSPTLAEDY